MDIDCDLEFFHCYGYEYVSHGVPFARVGVVFSSKKGIDLRRSPVFLSSINCLGHWTSDTDDRVQESSTD